ncbi:MAG: redox-regulated ATPase YchF [Dehalococcoidia bacterium]|nr:redox-regulated ATPase YchF [Dehalococcoidia bacterium]
MEISIIGLPASGKSTIFNALTKFTADSKSRSGAGLTLHPAIAKVPDERLNRLSDIFHPKKTTSAEIKYIDIGGLSKSFGKEQGVSGQLLNTLSSADALLEVIRAFEDENILHTEGKIDPARDIETLDMELIFSDLVIIEKRLSRLESTLKMGKSAERDAAVKEQELLLRIKQALDNNVPIRLQDLTADELRSLSNYQFLTAKPMLIVINIGENQLTAYEQVLSELKSRCLRPQTELISMCGKLEMELVQLNEQEADEFRQDIGLKEPAFDSVIKHSYALLGLISFFTVGEDEVKAWTIRNNLPALKAAGKIHTDIEKGFIRAEVIGYDDFIKSGNMAEARKHGLLRLEGKTYVVHDGDIINFLFNV